MNLGSRKLLAVGILVFFAGGISVFLLNAGLSSGSRVPLGVGPNKSKVSTDSRSSGQTTRHARQKVQDSTTAKENCSLDGFKERYSSILKDLRGKDARKASYALMEKAQAVLSLDELKEFCSGIESFEIWQHGIGLIAEKYAIEDYSNGLQWLDTLPADASSLPAFARFAKTVDSEHQGPLLDYALKRKDRNETGAVLAGLLSTGNESTCLKVIALANKQPDLMPSVLFPLSTAVLPFADSGDYQTAIKISEAIDKQSERQDALRNLMINAAQDDPVVASDLLSQIRTEKDKLVVIDPLISSWITTDPKAASSWALAQNSPILRDRAFLSISRALLTVSQDESLLWANSVSDPKLRESQIAKVLSFVKANGTQADSARLESQLTK